VRSRSRIHDRSSLPGGCPVSDTVAPVEFEPRTATLGRPNGLAP